MSSGHRHFQESAGRAESRLPPRRGCRECPYSSRRGAALSGRLTAPKLRAVFRRRRDSGPLSHRRFLSMVLLGLLPLTSMPRNLAGRSAMTSGCRVISSDEPKPSSRPVTSSSRTSAMSPTSGWKSAAGVGSEQDTILDWTRSGFTDRRTVRTRHPDCRDPTDKKKKSRWPGGCNPPASAGAARSAHHHRRVPRTRTKNDDHRPCPDGQNRIKSVDMD